MQNTLTKYIRNVRMVNNQRKVKKMVEEGRVQFKVVRLNEKGVKVK